jgi:K+-transporting ATPase KdpF subunit
VNDLSGFIIAAVIALIAAIYLLVALVAPERF